MLEKEISDDEMDLLFTNGIEKKEKPEEEKEKPEEEAEKEEVESREGPEPDMGTTEEKVEEVNIIPIDITQQKRRLSSEQMRTLYDIHVQFARQYQSELSSIMKMQARITSKAPEQIPYQEFIDSLPERTYMNLLALLPLDGTAVLQIDLDLALALIDRNLGGTGEPYLDLTGKGEKVLEEEIKVLSDIEQRVIERLLEPSLDFLHDKWENKGIDIEPTFMEPESIPGFLGLAFPEDIVIVSEFDVSIIHETAELLKSAIRICYPYMTLQPIASSLTLEAGRGSGGQTLNLSQVKVPVKCNLARVDLRVEELLNLEVDDLLELDVEINQAADVMVGQGRVFWGKPGRVRRKKAVKIESLLKEEIESIPSSQADIEEIDESEEEAVDEFSEI